MSDAAVFAFVIVLVAGVAAGIANDIGFNQCKAEVQTYLKEIRDE